MANRSKRLTRRYSTILALGLMTVFSKLVRAMRSINPGSRRAR